MDHAIPSQPPLLILAKAGAVGVGGFLLLLLGLRIVVALGAGAPTWALVGGLLVGYLAADLLSGTVHWFCDTFFDEETPLIGNMVIFPFRDHHHHPGRITHYRFLEQDTTSFFLMIPPLALSWWLAFPLAGGAAAIFAAAALFALALGSFGTNLCHKWAHSSDVPATVTRLQKWGLILSPQRHRRHHADHSRGFCVTSGWMNGFLDVMRFYPRCEALVRGAQRRLGLTPSHES